MPRRRAEVYLGHAKALDCSERLVLRKAADREARAVDVREVLDELALRELLLRKLRVDDGHRVEVNCTKSLWCLFSNASNAASCWMMREFATLGDFRNARRVLCDFCSLSRCIGIWLSESERSFRTCAWCVWRKLLRRDDRDRAAGRAR